MISPNYLKEGATVAIVSTARKISKKELIPAITILKKWGLKVVLGKSIEAEEHQFAGNDKLRTSDFQAMLDHPGIDAVWCARGGYGTVRIIDDLDFTKFSFPSASFIRDLEDNPDALTLEKAQSISFLVIKV